MLEYLEKMDSDVRSCVQSNRIVIPGRDGWTLARHTLLAKHVVVWHLQRDGFRA